MVGVTEPEPFIYPTRLDASKRAIILFRDRFIQACWKQCLTSSGGSKARFLDVTQTLRYTDILTFQAGAHSWLLSGRSWWKGRAFVGQDRSDSALSGRASKAVLVTPCNVSDSSCSGLVGAWSWPGWCTLFVSLSPMLPMDATWVQPPAPGWWQLGWPGSFRSSLLCCCLYSYCWPPVTPSGWGDTYCSQPSACTTSRGKIAITGNNSGFLVSIGQWS